MARTRQRDANFGWPPLLRTPTAARYAQRANSTLTRAAKLPPDDPGHLPVAGHNGRSLVFRREDLDRWLTRESIDAPLSRPTASRAPGGRFGVVSADSASIEERLEAARRGAK